MIAKMPIRFCLNILFLILIVVSTASAQETRNWNQWRGPLGTGESPHGKPPIEWSEKKNIRWKAAIPGLGHSTPIQWGDLIFLTSAKPFGERVPDVKPDAAPGAHDNLLVTHHHEFFALAVNRKTGKIVWTTSLAKERPIEGGHHTGSLASNSSVADENHFYAYFGSRGLFCLDHAGNEKWKIDFGEMQTKHAHGEGNSIAISKDFVIVNWDDESKSFLCAIDKESGKIKWKVERDEKTSWTSPIIHTYKEKTYVIVAGTKRIRGYNLSDGKLIWECGGLSGNVCATPVAKENMVIAGSSYEKQAMFGINLEGAKGDLTGTKNVVWTRSRRTPYVSLNVALQGKSLFPRSLPIGDDKSQLQKW